MSKPPSLRSPEEIERIAQSMERLMQTFRARVQRIGRIREMLATLNDAERFGLAAEMLGSNEDELLAVLEAGTQALKQSDEAQVAP